jgi:lysophospholipase L1-like esterase
VTTAIAANNPAILYSPYNWIAGASATTICAGAYFRTLFTGNSCVLNVNTANLSAPYSEIWARIDGYGPWTAYSVAATVTLAMPSDTTASAWHLLEVMVKSTSETINRWNAPSNTAVIFTGLTIDAGASVYLPRSYPLNVFVLGDSITEGVRTINSTAANDTDRNDNKSCWSFQQRELLGAEIGICGFGATGLTKGGSGNMPAATVYWNQQLPGVPRVFTPAPDLIIINHGTNDQSATPAAVTAALIQVLSGMLAATPQKTQIAVLEPFGGFQAAALQAAVSDVGSTRVQFVNTTGALNTAFGIDPTGLHPTGPNDLALVGPLVGQLLTPILRPAASGLRFRSMF